MERTWQKACLSVHVGSNGVGHRPGAEIGCGLPQQERIMSPSEPNVTVSTKTWEGDYRTILTAEGIEDLFGPLGRAPVRQVVLNRIEDVAGCREARRSSGGCRSRR